MKILFFIETLGSGGKERRLVELLSYLKHNTGNSMLVVLRRNEIEYPTFFNLNIPYKILTDNYERGDKTLHFKFFQVCKEYKPDIIHTWGNMPAFLSLLAVILLRIPHINSQITDAPPRINTWSIRNLINKINFRFSSILLANSYAGLKVYGIKETKKSLVIYNGVNFTRFQNLFPVERIKEKYKINTPYSVIMVASFTEYKDHDLFIDIAKEMVRLRTDVSFIAVGDGYKMEKIKQRVKSEGVLNIIFTGKIPDVEHLINCCDIGVLFSPLGEGVSGAIIEYMALGKPVIANDAGGTKEIVKNGINGYLITTELPTEIAGMISNLLDDKEKRNKMGEAGRKLIHESYTIDRMGKEFEKVYNSLLKG